MEWVETTGKTVEEAKEAALDQLGVDEQEAEFEVVEEPKSGLFGRMRREARVRARVEPKRPRPKADRRERRRRPPNGGRERSRGKPPNDETADDQKTNAAKANRRPETTDKGQPGDRRGGEESAAVSDDADQPVAPAATSTRSRGAEAAEPTGPARNDNARSTAGGPHRSRAGESRPQGEHMNTETVSTNEQAAIIEEFLEGLVDAFGFATEFRREEVDDELVEVQMLAADLGLLIGPKGQTLGAIQDLARTVLQRKATGVYEGRVRIDIGGYRNRRREALERFATGVADEVRATGTQKVLEPMSPADRKVVHDTINDLDGVATSSEGTEPYRRVVIRPVS